MADNIRDQRAAGEDQWGGPAAEQLPNMHEALSLILARHWRLKPGLIQDSSKCLPLALEDRGKDEFSGSPGKLT